MSWKDTLLLAGSSETFTSPVNTEVTNRAINGEERLLITQTSERHVMDGSLEDDEQVILDRANQYALYLILKNRFEEHRT